MLSFHARGRGQIRMASNNALRPLLSSLRAASKQWPQRMCFLGFEASNRIAKYYIRLCVYSTAHYPISLAFYYYTYWLYNNGFLIYYVRTKYYLFIFIIVVKRMLLWYLVINSLCKLIFYWNFLGYDHMVWGQFLEIYKIFILLKSI